MDIADLRREYRKAALDREHLAPDPVDQFRKWFEEAQRAEVPEPNAMVLATVDPEGQPFTRTVLLKKFDQRGPVFFTNFESRKADHIEANAKVSCCFLWLELERQVSLNGTAERISNAESFAYFASRPLGSRLGAWSSQQSSIIKSRSLLEAKLEEMKRKFADGKVPLPSFWGGYRIRPSSYEFWQGRQNRLHDRFLYQRQEADGSPWQLERLQP
ncbi:MAG: pyridoxamine 5'-phosphate oxidase [Verrucomicrobia bacterium]|jgi:pyridoxamine 5'-phosphate oxidase|nr:pyridoxamine 5'-phosphate oxidase [Verrucomicrobiota bacterium]